MGALTEIYAGFAPELSNTDYNGSYLIPWGRRSTPRKSIDEGLKKRGTGPKLWDLLMEQTKEFRGDWEL
jgi:hypothetical protein